MKRTFAKSLGLLAAGVLLCNAIMWAQGSEDKTSEAVYEAGSGVTAPKPRRTPNAQFSESARGKKVHGVVVLEMIVTPEGKVRDVKVVKSLEEDLDKRAISAVNTWRFDPGTKDGKPVAVRMHAQVEFNLY